MKAQSKRWLKAGGTAGLLMIALAGCGGGGDDATSSGNPPAPTPAPAATGAVAFPAASGIAFVGTPKNASVVVTDVNGNPVSGKTVVFTSSDPAVASVAGTGQRVVIDPKRAGIARITASVDGRTTTLDLQVQAAAPTTLDQYKGMFPAAFTATNGQFVVKSDISLEYSKRQLDQMVNGWNLMKSKYVLPIGDALTPGGYVEMYYTWDRSIVETQGAVACPTAALASLPVRTLRTCLDTVNGINVVLVSPDLDTKGAPVFDYATGLATVSQMFADTATPLFFEWPWLREGLAVAFKSGSFDASGNYTMGNVVQPELGEYKAAVASAALFPLSGAGASDLVDLTRSASTPPTVVDTWTPNLKTAMGQSGMLLNYLYRNKRPAVDNLIKAIVAGTVTSSQQAFDFILTQTGQTVAELDAAYKAYGATQ